MKNSKVQKKLSLTKLNITKLTNPHKIWGGTGDTDGTDDPQNPQGPQKNNTLSPKQPKCKENSQKVVWE